MCCVVILPSALFNRTNIIQMTTSVSQRLNILCLIIKIIAGLFATTLFVLLYARVGIIFTCGKHLHDSIISLFFLFYNVCESSLSIV